ncbi:MAG: hypothetical protein ABFE13_15145 [Phycisphaerales bacterium]
MRTKAAGPPEKGWEWDRHYVADVGFQIGAEYEIPPEYVQDVITAVAQEMERTRSAMEKCPQGSSEYHGLADYLPVVEQDLADLRTGVESLTPDERTTTWIKAPQRHRRYGPSKDISGFMWFRLIDVDEREVFGCWRPPLKEIQEHPCERLIPEEATRKLPPPRGKTEEYERYYVSLASIHDNQLPGSSSIAEGIWPYDLAQSVWSKFSWGPACGPDQAFIETALNRVKAELDMADAKADGQRRRGETPTATAPPEHMISTAKADIAEIQRQIDTLIHLIERLNKRKAEHDRLRRVLSTTDPPESPQQCAERIEKWWSENAQRLIDDIKAKLDALYPEIQAFWSDKWSWGSFCMMLADGKDNYEEWKASVWHDIHIQELQAVSRALASADQKPNAPGQGGRQGPGVEHGAQVININAPGGIVKMGSIDQTQNLAQGNRNAIGKEAQSPDSIMKRWLWSLLKAIWGRLRKRA